MDPRIPGTVAQSPETSYTQDIVPKEAWNHKDLNGTTALAPEEELSGRLAILGEVEVAPWCSLVIPSCALSNHVSPNTILSSLVKSSLAQPSPSRSFSMTYLSLVQSSFVWSGMAWYSLAWLRLVRSAIASSIPV
jgi:hypothetical protein